MIEVSCRVNGKASQFKAFPMARLLDVLREQGHCTGVKEGCGEGECAVSWRSEFVFHAQEPISAAFGCGCSKAFIQSKHSTNAGFLTQQPASEVQ